MTVSTLERDFLPWSIAGSYYEVCNCEAICPCRRSDGQMGGKPMYETCDFALSWSIERGIAKGIDLAGLNVVMGGRWETTPGDPWRVILYVDERATEAARDALTAIFLGRAGGKIQKGFAANIVQVYAVKSARIELDHTRARERIEVRPYLTVATREAAQHDFTVTCGIPGHDHPGQEIRAEVFRYEDSPFDWEIRGKCGFSSDFAYTS
jgi:hypothetical protein